MKKRIGFIGCYSNDVILMLAKVLNQTGQKVLLWDRNPLRTLGVSVPKPEGVYPKQTGIEYDGILFSEQEYCSGEDCDMMLIDFGMNPDRKEAAQCTELILLTDMLLHHIRRIRDADFPRQFVRVCVMRDTTEQLCKGEKEVREFLNCFPNRSEFFLAPDVRDVKNRYVCETAHEYNIRKASSEMQEVIYGIAGLLCPEFTEKELRKLVKQAERREYR